MTADTRAMLRGTLGRGIWPRFDRTGRVCAIVGSRRTIAEWAPIFRAHRAALAVHGALHRAHLAEHVIELHSTGPAGVAVRLSADCDRETTDLVMGLIDRIVARVGLAERAYEQ